MDRFDAFQYFLTNLFLHNLVLVVLAGLLGVVMGRLVFGGRKGASKQLRASLDEQRDRARTVERELERLQEQHEQLLAESVEPASGEDVKGSRLRDENGRLAEELGAALRQVEELKMLAGQARPAEDLAAQPETKAEVDTLEQRIADAHRERKQVEKASAVLRKEMRGLRSKVKEIERRESREMELEKVLKDTEERLSRSQAAEAKESRVRADLEKIVGDLERRLAVAAAERERLRDAVEGGVPRADDTADGIASAHGGGESGTGEGASEGEMDDLTQIKGIGAVLQKKLRAVGVTSLRQIAEWTDEDLADLSRRLRLRNRAERDDWRGQARTLCDGD